MQSNYFTSNENLIELATELADNQNFEEFECTTDYNKCDSIIIDGTFKTFWFTTTEEVEKAQIIIEEKKGTLTKNITLKDIKKWQTK